MVPALTYSQVKLPGLYSNFENLISIESDIYKKKKEKLKSTFTNFLDLKDINSVKLDPDFINHILFHSPSKYASLATKDECSFYDLILAGHIRDENGPIQQFIVEYENRKGKIRTALASKVAFLNNIAFIRCPASKNFEKYFNLKNSKTTLKKIFLETPTSQEACFKVHDRFIKDHKTPYLCKIYEEVEKVRPLERLVKQTPRSNYKKLTRLKKELRDAKTYKKSLNANSFDYLKNLCDNIEKPKLFCKDFFDASYWKKIAQKLRPQDPILNFCKELTKKKKLKPRDIVKCTRKLNSEKNLCHYLNRFSKSITPKPNCAQISKALNLSRLKNEFQDCPAQVGNLGMVNLARIMGHFEKTPPNQGSNCQTNTAYQFLKLNQETNDGRFWKNELCYRDKINQKDVCEPTLFGNYKDSPSSLTLLVEKILRRTRGFSSKEKCKIITESEFKPTLLEFKSGCWVILDNNMCLATDCKFKILNNEQEVTHIKLKTGVAFPYFADSFTSQSITQEKFLKDFYKKKSRSILNTSFLKSTFKEKENAIIHGIGCREDLLPTHFQKRSLNECSPIPFIIDGYLEDKGFLSLVVRTAYDDLHAPRIIPWSYIFSSVKAYQALSPLNLWSLYALY
jgi:hypothetical protein